MRTTVERNTADRNPWGGPGTPGWTSHLADVSCYAWEKMAKEIVGNTTVVVKEVIVYFPSGSEIRSSDRLAAITDRLGAVRFPGPIEIRVVVWRPDFLEVHGVSTL